MIIWLHISTCFKCMLCKDIYQEVHVSSVYSVKTTDFSKAMICTDFIQLQNVISSVLEMSEHGH